VVAPADQGGAGQHEPRHCGADRIRPGQRAKKAGDVAPEFTLLDPEGKEVSSRDLLARGPLVVSFYRGVWCPYCNLELQALQEALADITVRGR
jgi:peroxiredoxin